MSQKRVDSVQIRSRQTRGGGLEEPSAELPIIKSNNKFSKTRGQKIKERFLLGVLFFVVAISSVYFATFDKKDSQAATFSWVQGDWSLGANLSAIATYTLNKTGWQKFYSASDNIDHSTSNQITLKNSAVSVTHTSDADFNGGTTTGNIKISGDAVSLGCPENYIFVPANATYGTNAFCVMKYEAKNVGGIATSQADITPWVNINQTAAIAECAKTGGHLITNNEWMTIARNVEAQPANWTGNAVGNGILKRGNVGITDAASYGAGTAANFGTDRDTKAQLVLSNGETIWDLSGNVWEWTNDTIQGKDQPTGSSTGFAWREFNALTTYGTLSYDKVRPANSAYISTYGAGKIYSDGTVSNTTTYAFLRGGSWYNGATAGAFTLSLSYAPGISYYGVGFRCVR